MSMFLIVVISLADVYNFLSPVVIYDSEIFEQVNNGTSDVEPYDRFADYNEIMNCPFSG